MKVLLYQFHLKKEGEVSFATKDRFISNYGNYWELSSDSCKKYAERWGWDYQFDLKTEDDWEPFCMPEPQFEQFRSIEFLKDYDAVLFVDTDILIKPNSPNVVESHRKNRCCVVVHTTVGQRVHTPYYEKVIGLNSGVVIWYKKSNVTNDLYSITYEAYQNIGDYFSGREHMKWWENLQDFQPFMGKFDSGFHNDDKFLTWMISTFNLTCAHLDRKYNFMFTEKDRCDILSENVHFIHYIGSNKTFLEQDYNLIME